MAVEFIQNIVAQLASIPNRGAGTAGEKQAAEFVEKQFSALGLETNFQTFKAPKILGHAVALFVGMGWVGAMVGYKMPALGMIIALCSFFILRRMFNLGGDEWIHFVPCGESTNVVAKKIVPDAKRNFVFSAHVDAGQTGLMFHPTVKQLFAKFQGNSKSVQGPMYAPAMAIFIAALLLGAQMLGASGTLISWLHYGVAVFLFISLLVTVQFMLSPVVPGAIDNGSGVAAMAEVARIFSENGPKDTNLYFVATGAEETGMIGMKHFYHSHKDRFNAGQTYFINFESVGGGILKIVEEEGELGRFRYPPFMVGLTQLVAGKEGFGEVETVNLLAGTDSVVTANAGRPTLCLIALDELGVPPNYHEMADTAGRVDFSVTQQAADLAVAVCREIEKENL